MTATLLFHYSTDDPEFQNEYHSVEIFVDGKKVREYGDWYHDKGKEKASAFLEGFELGQRMPFEKIFKEEVADSEL